MWSVIALTSVLWLAQDADGQSGADAVTGRGFTFTSAERKQIGKLAKDARADGDVFVVKSQSFLVTAPNSAKLAAEIGVFLDAFQTAFFARLDVKPQVDIVPTIVIHATAAEFQRKCVNGERSAFLWLAKDKGWPEFHVHMALETPKLDSLTDLDVRPLQRGVARALLRRVAGRNSPPAWLEEGVASWFEGLDIRADYAADRTARCRRSPYLHHVRAISDDPARAPSLAALFAIKVEHWNTDGFTEQTQQRNALAEAFVDLLLGTDVAKSERKAVFEALRRGVPLDKLQAKELLALEGKWRDHMRELAEYFRIG